MDASTHWDNALVKIDEIRKKQDEAAAKLKQLRNSVMLRRYYHMDAKSEEVLKIVRSKIKPRHPHPTDVFAELRTKEGQLLHTITYSMWHGVVRKKSQLGAAEYARIMNRLINTEVNTDETK